MEFTCSLQSDTATVATYAPFNWNNAHTGMSQIIKHLRCHIQGAYVVEQYELPCCILSMNI